MLLASHFVLNQSVPSPSGKTPLTSKLRTTHRFSHTIYPYLHSFSNHPSTLHNLLRRVRIPDTCPADVLGGGQGGAFSLVAGDFEEIYGEEHWDGVDGQRGHWGAVVTCFFIDCVSQPSNIHHIPCFPPHPAIARLS